jgi:hypothetical protein
MIKERECLVSRRIFTVVALDDRESMLEEEMRAKAAVDTRTRVSSLPVDRD